MASTYLQRTPSTTGNRKKWTWSAWIKRSKISTAQYLLSSYESSSTETTITFNTADQLDYYNWYGNAYNGRKQTSMKFRDTNAWYHIVVNLDLDNATADDRAQIYVNGERITDFATSSNPTTGSSTVYNLINIPTRLGAYASAGNGMYFDGIMAHVHFVDGLQLDADTFGETDSTTGIWKPKTSPTISDYGTNGFFLDFASSSTMGNDVSGKNNDLAVSTGTMTQTIDTPSNVFATFNPLAQTTTKGNLSNGNLTYDRPGASDNWVTIFGTQAFTQGKYYFEYKIIDGGSSAGNGSIVGLINYDISAIQNSSLTYIGGNSGDGGMGWYGAGNLFTQGGDQGIFSSYTDGDIVMVAVDADNGYVYWGKNGSWINSGDPTSGATGTGGFALSLAGSNGTYCFGVSHREGGNGTANFGNGYFGTTAVASAGTNSGIGTFEYDVPSGYKALCTKNINAQEYS